MKMNHLIAFALAPALFLAAPPSAAAQDFEEDDPFAEEEEDFGFEEEEEMEEPVEAEVEASGTSGPGAPFGLGFVQTPSGFRAGEIEYHLPSLMIEGVFGLTFFDSDAGASATIFGLGGGGFFSLAEEGPVALMVGGRVILGILDVEFMGMGDSGFQLNLEAPLRVQWYLDRHFAFHAETGVALRVIDDPGDVFTNIFGTGRPKGVAFSIGDTNLVGSVGGTIYF